MVSVGEDFGGGTSRGCSLMSGIHAFIEETPESSLDLFLSLRTQQRLAVCHPEGGSLTMLTP